MYIHIVLSLSPLLQDGIDTPLIMAASEGHTDCIRELLSSGAVVDLADKVSI